MQKYIRNFSIIAHIDHGKSTLSKKIIKLCNKNNNLKYNEKIIDSMDLEKEKGITIKSHNVNLKYKYKNKNYKFNLIDTPGHTDFSYEVSRSLYASEGALLIIDATQGVEAQTLANYNIAKKLNINIIPIINKIDVSYINIKNIKKQITNLLKFNNKNILLCSAKKEHGINKIFTNIIKRIKPPKGNIKLPLQALIIDSYFNNYLGTILFVKIKNGFLKKNNKIIILGEKKIYKVKNIFLYTPQKKESDILFCGEVGWISCNIKKINFLHIGKTITDFDNKNCKNIPFLKKNKPQIYAGIYPLNNKNFIYFEKSFKKLILNDPSIDIKKENSFLLGFGFRCGFLGYLHMEITKERLKREYNLDIIITYPTVKYQLKEKNNKTLYINNPDELSSKYNIKNIKEPIVNITIISPEKYLGKIIKLCTSKRGIQKNILFHNKHIKINYNIPLIEIITNFSNKLKSISNGYASFNYYFKKYKKTNISLLNILINGKKIEGLSMLLHRKSIKKFGNKITKILKKTIKKQQFNIIIQSTCNNKIISRENIKALRKNVTSKCYGGDITRKKKLLQKQKSGKKKMKKIGNIILTQETFFKIIKLNI